MKTDPGLQPTRDIREKISREHGNDPRRLVEYYMDYQRRFSDRLRSVPHGDEVEEIADRADAGDQPATDR